MSENGVNTSGSGKKFFNWKWSEFIILVCLSVLAVLLTVVFYSVKFTDYSYFLTERGETSFWTASELHAHFSNAHVYINHFNIYFIFAFLVCVALYIAAALVMAFKNRKVVFYAATGYNAALCLVCIIMGGVFEMLRVGAIVACVFALIVLLASVVFLILRRKSQVAIAVTADAEADKGDYESGEIDEQAMPQNHKKYKLALLITQSAMLFFAFLILFFPVFSERTVGSFLLVQALSGNEIPLSVFIAFLAAFIMFFALVIYFAVTVTNYFRSYKTFVKQSKAFALLATVLTLIFFVYGYGMAFYINLQDAESAQSHAFTISYIPFLLNVAALIVHSVFCGKLRVGAATVSGERKLLRIEPLIYTIAITVATFISLVLNIVEIHAEAGMNYTYDVSLSGYKLLTAYGELSGGFQTLAFIEFVVLLSSGILLALAIVGFFAKSKSYYKLVKLSAVANFLFVLLIGLFGYYFKIAQKINMEDLNSIIDYYGINVSLDYTYEVKSRTIFMLIASFAVIVTMIIRGVFNLGVKRAAESAEDGGVSSGNEKNVPPRMVAVEAAASVDTALDFDACAAFTELDGKRDEFRAELDERRQHLFEGPTLPALVRFVVDYARECRLHLSYSAEDIATFVAGLGASRLAILQGMSGTGKTSLPKVFTEAIMGNCEIVEVESSWRDKNELLGYYNEFSKCFTPKKFTQCLYKAKLNPTVPTFIVLDEMNLSRIEYYFSDFLSLMEHEEDKREIKLLNVKLFRTENGEKIPYAGLTDGHTIKMPGNVWFIGTANRDESTFEISDKVYDRAQTMNFNKRAPKIHSFTAPLDRRFVAYDSLVKLFEDAKNNYKFEAEDNAAVQKSEKLLAPYNISFGNRILKQMEDFVKIYCACFGDKSDAEKDAVERILLSKVVSKLETKVVENKEALASEFDKLGLKTCGAFIRKLNED